jgi:hypothetical protein
MNALNHPGVSEILTADEVIAAFVELRGFGEATLRDSETRTRQITRMRHELWWLLRDLTPLSLREIGDIFDGRDASTIQSGINGMADLMAGSPEVRDSVRAGRAFIVAHAAQARRVRGDGALLVAHAAIAAGDAAGPVAGMLALTLITVAAILRSDVMSAAEARMAAVAVIRDGGPRHGH